ncbi:MAG: methionine biosynthesis protein MetW [Pseudomonadota bacterium]
MTASTPLPDNGAVGEKPALISVLTELVPRGARVLDVGCGDGTLLQALKTLCAVRGQGLELAPVKVAACVSRGLSVVQGDADTDLADYPDQSFEVVILTQTIQAMRAPLAVLDQSLRIGQRVIVSMPNFAHWALRLSFVTSGRMPRSAALPTEWFETENIHLCTIRDFIALCTDHQIHIDAAFAGSSTRALKPFDARRVGATNLIAREGLFVLSR